MVAQSARITTEIAHVLFMDIVGYSRLSMETQAQLAQQLRQTVRSTPEFGRAQQHNEIFCLDTGDGMALVFFRDPLAPAQCALEIAQALQGQTALRLRMGIHSGPVSRTTDINGKANVSGSGINMAQRVMDCGDPDHILLSNFNAEVICQYDDWGAWVHRLGLFEVKHGVQILLYNLITEQAGNPDPPERMRPEAEVEGAERDQVENETLTRELPTSTHAVVSAARPVSAQQAAAQPGEFKNPYDFGPPATREMFKGREFEINQLLDAVESDTHVSVFGLQRIGKTSLVEEALRDRVQERPGLKDRFYFASINFQNLGSEFVTYRDLFEALIEAIAGAMPTAVERDVKKAIEWFLSDAQDYPRGKKAPLFKDAERMLELIAQKSPRKIVLFLDEFSELCRANERNEELLKRRPNRDAKLHPYEMLGDVPLLRWFSSLLKNRNLKIKLVFIFAIRPFVAQYDTERELQILKLTSPVCLYYLEDAAARALITEPVRGVLQYEPGAVDYLVELTAGHPYLIQFFLKAIVDRVKKERSTILLQDIREFEERMISEGPAYEAQFALLDSDYSVDEAFNTKRASLGRGALALIARLGDEKEGGWVQRTVVCQAMQERGCSLEEIDGILYQLESAKILEQSAARGAHCYRIAIPLLRKRYIRQNLYLRYFQDLHR